ncbi:MAG: hypothetical protein QFF03_03255 [Pseudomonadota bacterium]|nr:hypothetical protein [Pseudomonadota bacterium]
MSSPICLPFRPVAAAALALSLALPLVAAAQTVDSEAGVSFKGTRRVAISQFGIEFYTQLLALGRSGGNTVRQQSTLTGVSQATRQALVDKMYAVTVALLKDAGFEVVPQEKLAADPMYQQLVSSYGKLSQYVVHDSQGLGDGEHLSTVVAPTGMAAFYASAGSSGGYIRANMSDRLDAQNYGIGTREAEIGKHLDATLVKFSFLASYGTTQASKNGLIANIANIAARASLETSPNLMAYETQVQFVTPAGPRMFGNVKRAGQSGAFYLKQPLMGVNIFATADSTSDDTKKSDNVINGMFSLFGGKNAVKTQMVEVTTTDAQYEQAFAALVTTASAALVKSLEANR